MHSPQLASSDSDQVFNPWTARSNDQDLSRSTATATIHQPRDDSLSAFRYSLLVSPSRATSPHGAMILSPSPPPQVPQPTQAQPPTEEPDTTQTDPRVESLKAIFPDFDNTVIHSVLESTNYDHDRALDVLLGMNDPSFMPPAPPPSQSQNEVRFESVTSSGAQRLSQEALDEQFARRLALEEEQLARHSWAPPPGGGGQTTYQAYQPRRGGGGGGARSSWGGQWGGQPQGQPQTTQGQGGRDTMTEFQEGFNRIAESGKKTFSSIVSKVRAKMQEFEQGQGWSGSQGPPPGQLPQSTSSSYHPSYATGQQQGPGQGVYAPPSNPPRQESPSAPSRTDTYSSSPPRSGVLRPTSTEPVPPANPQQSSYYDPNARGYDLYGDDEDEIQIVDKRTPSSTTALATTLNLSSATPPQTDISATPPPPSRSGSLPHYASPVPPSASKPSVTPPARSLSPVTTGTGVKPGGSASVDFSKLGLLPKRPISLVRAQSPPGGGGGGGGNLNAPRVAVAHSESTTDSSTDDREEPEFIENPFEDRRP